MLGYLDTSLSKCYTVIFGVENIGMSKKCFTNSFQGQKYIDWNICLNFGVWLIQFNWLSTNPKCSVHRLLIILFVLLVGGAFKHIINTWRLLSCKFFVKDYPIFDDDFDRNTVFPHKVKAKQTIHFSRNISKA